MAGQSHTAMANEALCKVLSHNLCCVIQSMYELGLNPVFWGKDEEPEKVAEPTPDTDEVILMLAWV